MLAIGVVCLTAAATITFAQAQDLAPLWIIGGLALIGVLMVDSRWVRHQAARVPVLRPNLYKLAEVIRAGNELVGQLRQTSPPVTDEDEWRRRVEAWYVGAQELIHQYWPEYLPTFQRQPGAAHFSYHVIPQWAGELARFVDGVLERLHDLQMRISDR
jgi:hypothetical protein